MRVKDARQTFLGWWIRLLIEGREIEIFGDGRQLRDFNYVDDVVDAFLRAAYTEDAYGRVINLGSSQTISLSALADLLVDVNAGGRCRLIEFPPERKAIDIGDYYSDWKLANNVLGWTPNTTLRDGLTRTLSFFREHRAHYW
jgi:dTDP-glucose 4,6-dehydratase/UDP-glucose 4-epimerase